MKKFFKSLAVGLGLCFALASAGCGQNAQNGGQESANAVYLTAITGADAVGSVAADYFLLAEPAVSAQRQKGYAVAGDIQSLYGGEKGYPQAVLVAKTELTEKYAEWLNAFTGQLNGAAAWLQSASGEQIAAAVNAHMADKDTQSSLKAPLLSAQAISGCGVRFSYAEESRAEVESFLAQMRAVNENAAAIPAQEFFWQDKGVGETVLPERELTVCMPDGAPALAMAELMAKDTQDDKVRYQVVAPAAIASKVTNKDESSNADLCVLPITAASKLLGNGTRYKMLGVVTHGNLYLISKNGQKITAENISVLKGKTIGVLQIKEVPGLTLKTVLKKYGLAYKETASIN